ncbi:transporter substrate-binding domain-containing protein [Brucella cytisi]|uniref:ABC transporter substrate-binding protein n=1 Tax=Brucella cytisi TaxID=407152 RepID=A0A1J6I4V8_9HYPH|nr:transporter substrate-binding domain-containing protein [Brucella cytisi]OIS92854.1 ABC transporter substrate-binding protein [Brucella cytisi]
MNNWKLSLTGAAAVALAALTTAQAETLRVGMECTYPPFNYRTADGNLEGYDVDVAKGVAEITGYELDYVCQGFDGLIPALLANKFDLIIASMSITDKRKQQIDFSIPYRKSVGHLVGQAGKGADMFDSNGQPIPEKFNGVRIGVERASTYFEWFKAKLPDADLVMYDGVEPMYLDLKNGRVDMIMTNPMKAYLSFLQGEGKGKFELVGPEINEPEYFGPGVGVGLRKGDDELRGKIDDAIRQLIREGKLKEYALKIFPFPIHDDAWADK